MPGAIILACLAKWRHTKHVNKTKDIYNRATFCIYKLSIRSLSFAACADLILTSKSLMVGLFLATLHVRTLIKVPRKGAEIGRSSNPSRSLGMRLVTIAHSVIPIANESIWGKKEKKQSVLVIEKYHFFNIHVYVMVQSLYVLVIVTHTGSVRYLSKSQTYSLFGLSLKEAFFPIVYPTCCGTASL